MSIIQGGPGFPCFHPAMYKYITTGDYQTSYVEDDDVPEAGVRLLISKVGIHVTSEELMYMFIHSLELQGQKKVWLNFSRKILWQLFWLKLVTKSSPKYQTDLKCVVY